MSVLIKGGRVVTAADDYVADVFIEGERVSLIGESLDVAADTRDRRDRQVRAAGLRRPAHPSRHAVRAARSRSTTSSRARPSAAFGGTTCHVDFSSRARARRFAEALEAWHARPRASR